MFSGDTVGYTTKTIIAIQENMGQVMIGILCFLKLKKSNVFSPYAKVVKCMLGPKDQAGRFVGVSSHHHQKSPTKTTLLSP